MTALHVEVAGEGAPVLLAHGFTQTARSWGPFAAALGREVHAVDLPGHGESAAVRADLREAGALLLAAAPPGPVDVVGYSLGGRVALHGALDEPERVRRLVVIGASAGIVDDERRRERRRRDEAMADDLEAGGDVDAFLRRWVALPLFAGLSDAARGLEARRANTAAGLASSLRGCGAGTQEPLWSRLADLDVPLLALAGAADVRYLAEAVRLARTVPRGLAAAVPGAGHAAHLHQPILAARLVTTFLGSH